MESTALHGMNAMKIIAEKLPGSWSYAVGFFLVMVLINVLGRINRTLVRIADSLEKNR